MISKEMISTDSGLPYGIRERWQISGFLQADNPPALSLAIATLVQAYSFNYRRASLHLDDGQITPHVLPALSPLGGTRVVEPPSFPASGEADAEYTSFRRYRIVLESEYLLPGAGGNILLTWVESLSFQGGGSRFVYLQPLLGLPQRQLVATHTPFRVSQQGQAVGLGAYPVPAPPVWPAAEHRDRQRIDYNTPRRVGGNAGPRYLEYPCSWAYEFESAAPLAGVPTLWR